ncbi:hypothetical protein NEHOM01_1842 [Nematocida homosporus]|uniref:uncharacterized protein n=1 Tax=Nematocida homosporus TaxID=1912981 RepID=UPI00221ED4F4|nr:uncharacterized protein NEHOM01_1842 [Nematocida homosporus]KAI5186984.1 hypothetical protein NEHOM01_1842 [Nematocida homosporus]
MTPPSNEMSIMNVLASFELGKYQEAIDRAWKVLYDVIIPYNTPGIQEALGIYIVVLRQLLGVPEVSQASTRILNIIDLIVHPRKGSILDNTGVIGEDEEIPKPTNDSAELDESMDKDSEDVKESKKKVCFTIVE